MPEVIRDGKVVVSTPLVSLTGTSPVELYRCMPPGVKFVPTKILIYNADTANHTVYLSLVNTSVSPPAVVRDAYILRVPAGQMLALSRDSIPLDHGVTTDPAAALISWAARLGEAIATSGAAVYIKVEFEVL